MKYSHLVSLLALLPSIVGVQTLAERIHPYEMIAGRPAAAGEIILKFRDASASQAMLNQFGIPHGAAQQLGHGAMRLRSSSFNTAILLKQLRSNDAVEWVEPNYVVSAASTPNDAYFPQQWNLRNVRQVAGAAPGADIQTVKAWDVATGSASIAIAILDTGIDYRHMDLAANTWTAAAPYTLTTSTGTLNCPAGSHGFRLLASGGIQTCDPLDDAGHGTHVAGIIGASGNNLAGVSGINWKSTLVPIKVLDKSKSGFLSDVILGIRAAIQLKAQGVNIRVINASIDVPNASQALKAALAEARDNEILVVTAAGNNALNIDTAASFAAPAPLENVLTVSATDASDTLASFSNFGSKTADLAAPGVGIFSTLPGNDYGLDSGTSQAAAHVSGAAALILSACTLDTAKLRTVLLASIDRIPDLTGKTVTAGRLNTSRALSQCQSVPKDDFTISLSSTAATVLVPGSTSTTLTVTPKNGFSAAINFTATGLPAGASLTFQPSTVTGSGSTQVTFNLPAGTPSGLSPITITGTSATLIAKAIFNLTASSPNVPAPGTGVPLPSSLKITVPSAIAVGESAPILITLPSPSIDGTTVDFTVSDPAVGVLNTSSVYLPAGQQAMARARITGTANGVVTLTATSLGLGTASTQIKVGTGSSQLTIPVSALPDGMVSVNYIQPLAVTGGSGLYTWSVISGSLPPGIELAGGQLSGIPTAAGTYTFTAKAIDQTSANRTATVALALKINAPTALLTRVTPNLQDVIVGQPVAPITVLLTDTQGNPKAGAPVTFSPTFYDINVSIALGDKVVYTDAAGHATLQLDPPTRGQSIAVYADSPGVAQAIPFAVKVLPNPAAPPTTTPQPATTLSIVGNSQQTVPPAGIIAPLTVIARDANGQPIPGLAVVFTPTYMSLGSSSPNQSQVKNTDASGQASLQLLPSVGFNSISVSAQAPGVGQPVTFNIIIAGAGATSGPVTLTAVGQTVQTVAKDSNPAPVTVVAKDQQGQPIEGLMLAFAPTFVGANQSIPSLPKIVMTGADGRASYQMGPANGGWTSISVAVQTATPGYTTAQGVTFTINIDNPATPPPTAATLTPVGATVQTVVKDSIPAPFTVIAKDPQGQTIAGLAISFNPTYSNAGGSSPSFAQIVTTGADGRASYQMGPANGGWTSISIAAQTASPGYITAQGVTFTINIDHPATPPPTPVTITALSATVQTVIRDSIPAPLTVVAKDAQGLPIAGLPILFAPTFLNANSSSPSLGKVVMTEADGRASYQMGPANGATRIGIDVQTASPTYTTAQGVTFTINITSPVTPAPTPATLTAVGVTVQTVVKGGIPAPLTVVAKDTNGQPISGLTVSFAPTFLNGTQSSPSMGQMVTTGADGRATYQVGSANSGWTGISITAQASSPLYSVTQVVTFTINITSPSAPGAVNATVTAVSPTLQTVPVGGAIAPFVVSVKTAAGIPIPGHTVTFTTIYVDGFQSANGPVQVVTTDASGLATIQLPPPVGGLAIAVTATAVGVTQTASFGVKIGANTSSTPAVVINSIAPLSASQSARVEVMLSSPAPPDGVTLTLTTSNSSVASLNTTTLYIPGGQQSNARAIVTGVSAGTALITVNSPLGNAVASVTVKP